MEFSETQPRLTDDPVAMAAGTHPFPFRTRQLSPPAPMVLGGRPPGRVGRRRILSKTTPAFRGGHHRVRGRPRGTDRASLPNDRIRRGRAPAPTGATTTKTTTVGRHARMPASGRPPRRVGAGAPAARRSGEPRGRAPQGRDGRPRRDRDDGSRGRRRPTGRATASRAAIGTTASRGKRASAAGARRQRAAPGSGRRRAADGASAASASDRRRDRRDGRPASRRRRRPSRPAPRGRRRSDPPARAATERSPTRSGIQYPTPRAPAPATREPDRIRPRSDRSLRTVKGAGVAAGARRSAAARRRRPAHGRQGARRAPSAPAPALHRGDRRAAPARRSRTRARAQDQLARAAEAFARGPTNATRRASCVRCRDAYPDAAAVRELLGLVHYRLGPVPGRDQGARRRSPTSPARSSSTRCSWTAARAQRQLRQGRGALGGARGSRRRRARS